MKNNNIPIMVQYINMIQIIISEQDSQLWDFIIPQWIFRIPKKPYKIQVDDTTSSVKTLEISGSAIRHLQIYKCSVYQRSQTKEKSLKTSQKILRLHKTGDEGIEPPPKVLETPIIPLDQSPIAQKKAIRLFSSLFECTFKTTHNSL